MVAAAMLGLSSDGVAFVVTLITCVLLVEFVKFLAKVDLLSTVVARKVMHIATGPVFILCWPMFTSLPGARVYAAAVPVLITLKFALVGLGVIRDEATVKSVSRSGNRRELLRGPLLYGIVFVLATYLYWRTVTGVVSLIILCAGDGFADVVGRRFGMLLPRIPWCPRKTVMGSLAFIVSSMLLSLAFSVFMVYNRWEGVLLEILPFESFVLRLFYMVVVAAMVESLPIVDWDNITVFIAAVVADHFYMGRF